MKPVGQRDEFAKWTVVELYLKPVMILKHNVSSEKTWALLVVLGYVCTSCCKQRCIAIVQGRTPIISFVHLLRDAFVSVSHGPGLVQVLSRQGDGNGNQNCATT